MFTARVTLEDIAAEAGFNKFWLVRLFRSTFGTTPHAYLLMLRVNRARQLLAEGSRPVDVALEVGFADQAHLTRWFGRAFGVSPTTYARQARKPPPGQFCSRRE